MEKRAHRRTIFASPVYFNDPKIAYRRYIKNRSRGGLLIRARDHIEPGTELTLCYPAQGISLKMKGIVVRSGERGLGVIFTSKFSPRSLLAPDRHVGDLLDKMKLTPDEQFCIRKYLPVYRELEAGRAHPATESRRRFVRVCRGMEPPGTIHETAYMKWKRISGEDFRKWVKSR